MIDEEATFKKYGYHSTDWGEKSHKKVVAVCDGCGAVRFPDKREYYALCPKCAMKNKVGKFCGANNKNWAQVIKTCKMCGKEYSVKKSQSEKTNFCSRGCVYDYAADNYSGENSRYWVQRITKVCEYCGDEYGVAPYLEDITRFCSRECMDNWRSETICGDNNPNWNGGVSFEPYCEHFNEAFKKKIRDKYDGKCFICGKTTERNGRNMNVHHVEYSKDCLCDGVVCEFVPLCNVCHPRTNFNRFFWRHLILYALQYEEEYNNVDS